MTSAPPRHETTRERNARRDPVGRVARTTLKATIRAGWS